MASWIVGELPHPKDKSTPDSRAEDQQPVQALSAKRLDPALSEGVCVRRPDWRAGHPDPFGYEDIIEGAGELGVSVADEKADLRALVREAHRKVPRLLGDEGRVRVGR